MANLVLKKSIATEMDFVKKRLGDYRAIAAKYPDDLLAAKMIYFYEGQLEVLTNISYILQEESLK